MTILAQTRCLQKTEYRYVFAVGYIYFFIKTSN